MAGRVFTDEKRAALLGRLRRHGRIGWALEEAGVVHATFYKTRDREPAFERAVQEALLAAAAGMLEDEEQRALGALDGPDGVGRDGGGRTLADNVWLRTRLQAKADRFRYARGEGGEGLGSRLRGSTVVARGSTVVAHGSAGEADRADVAGKLSLLARRLERGGRR